MIEITMPVPLPRRQRRALKFLKLFGAACVLFAGYKLLEIGVFALAGDPLVAWEEKVLHASVLVYGFFTVIAWKMHKMYGWVNVLFLPRAHGLPSLRSQPLRAALARLRDERARGHVRHYCLARHPARDMGEARMKSKGPSRGMALLVL